jgi:recombination associated protein RdgC
MAPFFERLGPAIMWFKNLQIYRLTAPWTLTSEQLQEKLSAQAFAACSSGDMQSEGWLSPRDNDMLVHTVNRQLLLQLGTEKKLLPSTVINQVTKARAAEIEEQQGFKPGRKQMKELKEQVTDELLPRAFSIRRTTNVWIDPVNGWMVVDAASPAKADEVFKLLLKSLETLPFASLRTALSPLSAMTDWLAADEAPGGFTVDQDTELRATGEGKATVRYVRHTLEPEDVRRHIAAGKQCTRLAMTWSDRVSFVLTESLAVKRVAPLDVLKENTDSAMQNEDERFDTDFALMTGELAKLMADLVEALGGEEQQKKAA